MSIPVEQQDKKTRYDIVLAYLGTLIAGLTILIKMALPASPIKAEHNHIGLENSIAKMQQSIEDLKVNSVYIRDRIDKIR